MLVDTDSPAFADGEPGRPGQCRVRAHAEREDNDVGRIHLPALCLYLEDAVVPLREGGHAVVERQMDAVPHQVGPDDAGEFPVERGQHLVEQLDERHVEPNVDQVLGHLETDEPAAHHHRPPHGLDRLDAGVVEHPREERRAALHPLADGPCIRHGPHLEYPGEVDARQRRTDRRRAGGQHQRVVGLGDDLAGRDVPQVHGLRLRRDRDRLTVRADVDRELLAEQPFVRDQQARLLRYHAPDVVGEPAVGIRHVGTALYHENLGVLVQPPEPSCTGGATGHPADDDDLLSRISVTP